MALLLALMMCGCKQSAQIGDEVEIDIVETEYDGQNLNYNNYE